MTAEASSAFDWVADREDRVQPVGRGYELGIVGGAEGGVVEPGDDLVRPQWIGLVLFACFDPRRVPPVVDEFDHNRQRHHRHRNGHSSRWLPARTMPTSRQLLTLGALFLVIGLVIDSLVGAGKLGGVLAPGSRTTTALSVISGLTFATLATILAVEAMSG